LIRLTKRDIGILEDIGRAGMLTYKHIIRMGYFKSYASCAKRMGVLQSSGYIKGHFYQTDEKLFVLDKDGIKAMASIQSTEFRKEDFTNIFHKLMRSELYVSVKPFGISGWTNEARVADTSCVFDVYFEHKGMAHLVEVHNAQKSKVLRKKLEDCLTIPYKFVFVVYCHNKNTISKLVDRMNNDGFTQKRKYAIKVFEYQKEVAL
jgi:hypothetical protein